MKNILYIVILLLTGCTTIQVPNEFTYKEIPTSEFTIASWQKITDSSAPYKIYIEGDGYAFNARGQISSDPTPRGTLLREIAFGDKNPNVIYLARPCQYIKSEKCEKKYWSTARFSPEVIDAEYQAIQSITRDKQITLIGFSGGAQVAGLLAVTKKDLKIKKIITIAGNLNHKQWTTYHHLPPLTDSLNLQDYKEDFSKIPQIHYVGSEDKIIPPILQKTIVSPSSLIVIKGATHNRNWQKTYKDIQKY